MRLLVALSLLLAGAAQGGETQKLGPAGWKGGSLDARVHKVWSQSVLWRHGQSRSLGLRFATAQDWSEYSSLGMWLHSEKATG
jgi:hypothetical protein